MSATTPLLRNVQIDARPKVICSGGRAPRPSPFPLEPVKLGSAEFRPPAPPAADVGAAQDARQAALLDGHAQGLKEGLAAAELQIAQALQQAKSKALGEIDDLRARLEAEHQDRLGMLDRAVLALEEARAQMLAQAGDDAAALALEVIGRILGDAEQRLVLVRSMAAQAMAQLKTKPVRIRLGLEDFTRVTTAAPDERSELSALGLEWVADPTITAGGCIVEAEGGSLDARLDQQLSRLLETWRQSIAQADEHPELGVA